MLFSHIINLHARQFSVAESLLDRKSRIIGMHMNFYEIFICHADDGISNIFQVLFKLNLIFTRKLCSVEHNDKFRTVTEFDVLRLDPCRTGSCRHRTAGCFLNRLVSNLFSQKSIQDSFHDRYQTFSSGIDHAGLFQHRKHLRRPV